MGSMVVKPEMVVQDGEVGVVQFQKMLQPPCPLVWNGLNIVHCDGLDVDGACSRCPAEAQVGK